MHGTDPRLAGIQRKVETLRGDIATDATLTPLDYSTHDTVPAPAAGGPLLLPTAIENLPDLEVVRILAQGGMGRVILAHQRSLDRDVAVKTVRPDVASPRAWAALLQEGVITGSLEHPNIVPIHILGIDAAGRPMLVMKRVEGVSWTTLIDDPSHPQWRTILGADRDRQGAHLAILMAVCNAVHFAHRRGVVHRDIKPENVMVGEFGEVYLVDWGIALDAACPGEAPTAPIGTPGFMAPEMVCPPATPIDARTDVFLLGATLHYVLTGTVRNAGQSVFTALLSASKPAPIVYPSSVPPELGEIANRATAANAPDRFPTAVAFRDALLDYLQHRGSVVLSDAAFERLDEVKSLHESGPMSGTLGERHRLRRLLTECRFGFAQALAAWSDNVRAKGGLRECLLLTLEYEVERGNLEVAESLLGEVDDPPEETLAKVHVLRDDVRAKAMREARFRDLEQQLDWREARGARFAFFLVVLGIAFGIWFYAEGGQFKTSEKIPPMALAGYTAFAFGIMVVAVFLGREKLFTNRVNRQAVFCVLLITAGLVLDRVLNAFPAPPTPALISQEMAGGAIASALCGLLLARWIWLQVPVFVVTAVLARAVPEYSGLLFLVALAVSIAFAVTWHRSPVAEVDAAEGVVEKTGWRQRHVR